MKAQIPRTKVEISQQNKVTYIERKTLFGLVKWWEKVRSDTLGNDLVIDTDMEIESIYLNGKKIDYK